MRKQNKTKSVILFFYLWLCIGFPLGLWVLLVGPSNWLAEYAQATDMEISQENIYGKLIIVAYIIVSFILAFYFNKFLKNSKNKSLNGVLVGVLSVLLFAAVYVFSFQPQWLISSSGIASTKNTRNKEDQYKQLEFVYGSYPDEEMIEDLKEQGFDGIISLLNEKVIPAEPALMKDESKLANENGIKLISFPMMPWVSENRKTLQDAKKFIQTEKGLYYVHCYLGRDRVNIFKSAAKRFGVKSKEDETTSQRKIDEFPTWTRGDYFKLEKDVYLTPYPTDDEYMMFVLNGNFKTVISLLDDTVPDNLQWIDKEKNLLLDYSMNYVHFPTAATITQKELDAIKKIINQQEKPVLLHGFLSKDNVSNFIKNNY